MHLFTVQACNGEVINADAVQLYKGLDIPCNKVTGGEQTEVKHHLLDMLDSTEIWTVHDYKKAATPIIDDICSRGKLPILCGGTNYYIQALLWPSLVGDGGQNEANGETEQGVEAASAKESTVDSAEAVDAVKRPNPNPNRNPNWRPTDAYKRWTLRWRVDFTRPTFGKFSEASRFMSRLGVSIVRSWRPNPNPSPNPSPNPNPNPNPNPSRRSKKQPNSRLRPSMRLRYSGSTVTP